MSRHSHWNYSTPKVNLDNPYVATSNYIKIVIFWATLRCKSASEVWGSSGGGNAVWWNHTIDTDDKSMISTEINFIWNCAPLKHIPLLVKISRCFKLNWQSITNKCHQIFNMTDISANWSLDLPTQWLSKWTCVC